MIHNRESLIVIEKNIKEGRRRHKLGIWDYQIHTAIYKIDKTTRSYCIAQRAIQYLLINYNRTESEKEHILYIMDIINKSDTYLIYIHVYTRMCVFSRSVVYDSAIP